MPLVLSTKILPPKIKKHLWLSDISLVEYNAIKILPKEIPFSKSHYKNAIFTSQNAVKIAIENYNLTFDRVFCVGEKTSQLLVSLGINPIVIEKNAKFLAKNILENYSHLDFDFFCSTQRRDELPDLLHRNLIDIKEHHIYESVIDSRTFSNEFDAVLCFSPLGVKAYYDNHEKKPLAICIGETSANEARRFTQNVLISKNTTLESVVTRTVKYFRH